MENKEPSLDTFMGKLKEIIKERLDHPDFSIDQICLEMKASRAQLHRKVKAATGLSTSLFIRQMRMEQAKLLLGTTQLNISQIAYQVGISSPQNFSKYFIEAYGISPSAYRKTHPTVNETSVESSLLPAPVPAAPESEPAPESTEVGTPLPVFPQYRRFLLLLALLFIVVVGTGILIGLYYKKNQVPYLDHPSLVMLPFKNQARIDPELLSIGIEEDILLHLKQLQSLRILPATDTVTQADYALEGEWEFEQQKLRLKVFLIRVADQRRIWKKHYDSQRFHLPAIAGALALQVARTLQLPLSNKLAERIQYQPTTSGQAYQWVLRGRYLLKKRTQESLQGSLRFFDRAIQADHTYSDAYLGKADALHLLVSLKYSTDAKRDLRKAEQLSLLAIKHGTNNGYAYAMLGNIYQQEYRWQEALTSYQIALRLNQYDALTNYWYSLALRSTGKLNQALHYNKIAQELDPDYPVITTGYIYTAIFARKFGLADTLIQRASPSFKQSFLYPNALGLLLSAKGQYESALPYFDTCQMMNPNYHPPEVTRGFCLGKLGKRPQVETFFATLDTSRARDCIAAAAAYTGLGQLDLGVAYLQAAAAKGVIPEYILVDFRFSALHAHPGCRKILAAHGLGAQLK